MAIQIVPIKRARKRISKTCGGSHYWATDFRSEWAVRHVPSQGQLEAMMAIMKQGGKPIITAIAPGKLIITAEAIAEPEPERLPADTQPETPSAKAQLAPSFGIVGEGRGNLEPEMRRNCARKPTVGLRE